MRALRGSQLLFHVIPASPSPPSSFPSLPLLRICKSHYTFCCVVMLIDVYVSQRFCSHWPISPILSACITSHIVRANFGSSASTSKQPCIMQNNIRRRSLTVKHVLWCSVVGRHTQRRIDQAHDWKQSIFPLCSQQSVLPLRVDTHKDCFSLYSLLSVELFTYQNCKRFQKHIFVLLPNINEAF